MVKQEFKVKLELVSKERQVSRVRPEL